MRVLAIDTSGDHSVIAVTVEGELRVERHVRARSRQGETLLPAIERALELAELTIAEIDLIGVGLGPGSFTGVRIGVATAKGLALARQTPIVGVRTSRVIARGLFGRLRVPVIDAHKGEVFVAMYEARDDGTLVLHEDDSNARPAIAGARVRAAMGEAACPVLAGSGLLAHHEAFVSALGAPAIVAPRAFDLPRGALLALEAEEAFAHRGADDLATLEPLYVRASDAVPSATSARGSGAGADR
jgi:tRNA threonylcarbamoyladenosine biosynthesis protein TsaB